MSGPTNDPAEDVTRALIRHGEDPEIAASEAAAALDALTDAGWRIVRTEPTKYADHVVLITEEWTP